VRGDVSGEMHAKGSDAKDGRGRSLDKVIGDSERVVDAVGFVAPALGHRGKGGARSHFFGNLLEDVWIGGLGFSGSRFVSAVCDDDRSTSVVDGGAWGPGNQAAGSVSNETDLCEPVVLDVEFIGVARSLAVPFIWIAVWLCQFGVFDEGEESYSWWVTNLSQSATMSRKVHSVFEDESSLGFGMAGTKCAIDDSRMLSCTIQERATSL
jgi:hypothetical protein